MTLETEMTPLGFAETMAEIRRIGEAYAPAELRRAEERLAEKMKPAWLSPLNGGEVVSGEK
jgi:hypothetical protein